jgi:hypothetical protein
MKKIMAFVLCLVMILSMCAMPAMAEGTEKAAYRTLYSLRGVW